ncbi:DUF1835 domain-containing protein [Tenacibaculum maritimum]|uniref:DUF1835 domain-containing protein n=1 Tax=Tenacibaculum maritimum TaxID=107401 RepID=UPI0012E6146A|nr:DUF1835 domain-containing protein [Tenacibaculum maritimum]MCD9563467.1 DUF1835 domain-containing protein [Tenacibaculum maritimum]MCD9566678.1 DUF1835 domain-containing protein [Tenacibaculum maritimum]MCD9579964.1 DUF1835 domain-containing protein [Tenacibaculum maritimum]MCD9597425.1 DUF1835 domain-containing protein [Tenacibaculum maritimum]MCD9614583.1 DUF1835 domain-containing protein [Tenacibaculum maritimum]
MDNILHIFSDENALDLFKKSEIKGHILLFKEALTEGPISEAIFSDDFWSKRYAYFEQYKGIPRLTYFDRTIKKIAFLEDVSTFDEVVIWGDFSIPSQVNIIALCAHLYNYFCKDTRYSLVCSGKHKGRKELQKLTNYTSKEFEILYAYKAKLTLPNLRFTKACWEAFASKELEKKLHFNFNCFPAKFQYLSAINTKVSSFLPNK